jgi:hypothetical protein
MFLSAELEPRNIINICLGGLAAQTSWENFLCSKKRALVTERINIIVLLSNECRGELFAH